MTAPQGASGLLRRHTLRLRLLLHLLLHLLLLQRPTAGRARGTAGTCAAQGIDVCTDASLLALLCCPQHAGTCCGPDTVLHTRHTLQPCVLTM
jgi:hypothetical protein